MRSKATGTNTITDLRSKEDKPLEWEIQMTARQMTNRPPTTAATGEVQAEVALLDKVLQVADLQEVVHLANPRPLAKMTNPTRH